MLGIVSHPDCLEHDAGPLHPDTRRRLDAISNQMISSGLDFVVRHYDAPLVTRAQLERVHEPVYLDRLEATSPAAGLVAIDGDTVLSPGTLRAAQRAAGAGVLGVDLILSGEAGPVFCPVRPPGHHAEAGAALGFCLFNNIAVASAHALDAHGLKRVAIIDFDAHHGNGTEEIFKHDKRILFCSSFQHPFYPFTGHASETPNLVAIPLAAGATGPEFREAVADHWLPALERFAPQMVFISAGFDAHILDDMSDLCLTEADYVWVTDKLLGVARAHGEGRVLSMLEGGYEPAALARSVVAHLKALIG
ncbi:histone deacetylase family protein [Aurantimonas sp. C2-5-R2]|uniref:histone deacetylase family protein n=1 Tax=unclassified Aurantimonas TaxID=2638230 RepID=UPI002E17F21C|nr:MULTISPECIES: histone deacetylase family protein [unclassified Aurantimonas]MEC5291187.1 histone deacetylase family protein [Aurantimonas sp. C2-3-R2]MEC5412322.1 histone deacetylase family protein [Aurantimonas sp. C2-4-R8]